VISLIGAAWSLRFPLALLAAFLSSVTCYFAGRHSGAEAAHEQDALSAVSAVAAAEQRYRDMEVEHAKRIEALRLEYATKDADAKAVDAEVARDLGSGVRRLRVHVSRCRPAIPEAAGAPARADDAATAELAPETAAAFYAIAADGDTAIRQLTALQAWARSAVELCIGGK
jgi:prophage endopeptidase